MSELDQLEPAQATTDPSRIGGRYRIESTLAEGGMGAVYQVIDERSGQSFALKRMRGERSRYMLALFEREYRTLAGIQHPRIIRAFDYGVDAGGPYYTMELAKGRDLYELAPLPPRDACRYLRDVATCLALLHTRRLLHRDVTPRNVRVLASGECKLIDFGALTAFGIPDGIVGTPPGIPPEALKQAVLDQRSDIFSFGALLYWALTRRHAYPAARIQDLPTVWRQRPAAPSSIVPGIPSALDALVLSLLKLEPVARPATMAEVVERLTTIAELPVEDAETQRALAESYLVQPNFVGRQQELAALRTEVSGLDSGHGSATLVMGPNGAGRSRLLREALLQAQLAGVRCLYIGAGMHRQPNGIAIAILQQLLDVSPAVLREAQAHAASLVQLDRELVARLGVSAPAPQAAVSGDWRARVQEVLLAIVMAACREQRLLLVVDDMDEADDGSLAMLAGLLRVSEQAPLALVFGAHVESVHTRSRSWQRIAERSKTTLLNALDAEETLVLARSLFGDAPNLVRFAEWLHVESGGLVLHCMELVRRLHGSGEIRYLDGLWMLPAERPASRASEGLEQLLAQRLDDLSAPALALAQALAVQRGALTRERCLVQAQHESKQPFALFDELVRSDVLEDSLPGYRFTHAALRQVLLARTSEPRRRQLHRRCADWELAQAGREDHVFARIEAGWHLLQAGEESRGADELAAVAYDTVGVRSAFADLQVVAPALEAALIVYTRQGRHLYERLPLIAALAQAGYYEERIWGDRYGDEALAAIEQVSGLTLARKLTPWLGKTLGLVSALAFAALRFTLSRERRRGYRFADVLVQLFGVVTALTGAAALALDLPRTERIAARLAPFLHMPARLTPVGIAQFCASLREICRENQHEALAVWTTLIDRFNDRNYYPTLPDQARPLYLGGLWFARGVFEAFRDEGGALIAADMLDALGLKLYRMIGSALRALHFTNRGQLDRARHHREQVDLYAIQIGSAWQVELWEPMAMILPYMAIGDGIEMRRLADRIGMLARNHPWLERYKLLAELAGKVANEERTGVYDPKRNEKEAEWALSLIEHVEPRSFVGWAASLGQIAHYFNMSGNHAQAQACCERALSQLGPADRPFVALFLHVELELAVALAGLGDIAGARRRLDELLTLHQRSDNPLTRGRLHAAYARVDAFAENWPSFRHHLEEARSWYHGTGLPALIAQVERLRSLDPSRSAPPEGGRVVKPANDTTEEAATIALGGPPENALAAAESTTISRKP